MPKKRRTRKEKIHTSRGRGLTQHPIPEEGTTSSSTAHKAPLQGITFSLPTTALKVAPQVKQAPTVAIATTDYDYLGKDLLKTAFLTSTIVVAELLIRFFYLH